MIASRSNEVSAASDIPAVSAALRASRFKARDRIGSVESLYVPAIFKAESKKW